MLVRHYLTPLYGTHHFLVGVILLAIVSVSDDVAATPAITPNCASGLSLAQGLQHATYDKTGYGHPQNHADFETLVANYATPANVYGSGFVPQINGSGNPFGSGSNYLSIFSGFIEAPTTGIYGIGVDGDDAIEVIIDGVTITGWYGGHGRRGSAQNTVSINLDAGYHTIEFRHEEVGGGDNYYLYWQPPGAATYSIVPINNLSSCQPPAINFPAITPACSGPAPGLKLSTYDITGYGTYPTDHDTYNALVLAYANASNFFGTGTVANVNGSGNPYGQDSNYLSVFTGYIFAPISGTYYFGVDGDDAVEVLIDGQSISGYYGAHGSAGSPQAVTGVQLSNGYHSIEFRHQEIGGGDNYYLYWMPPGSSSFSIVGNSNLSHCRTVDLAVTKTVDNPTPNIGGVITFTLSVTNNGPDAASDVTITDVIPDGFTYVPGTMTGGDDMDQTDPTGAGLSWTINYLSISPPSNSIDLTFSAIVNPL